MELYFLNPSFAAASPPVDTAISVVWSLQYAACGTFSAVLPLTCDPSFAYTSAELLTLAHSAEYLCDRQYCGRIETVICRDNTLEIGGRLLECLLYDRVVSAETTYTGTLGEAVAAALQQWAADLPLTLSDFPALTETGPFLIEAGESLGRWLHRLLLPLGAGYTLTWTGQDLVFAVTQGVDRSLDSSAGVSRAIFSEEFGNIASLESELYREEALTKLYVQGGDGTVVSVNQTPADRWPREGYQKAADLRPAQFSNTTAYQNALLARAQKLLQEAAPRSRLTCTGEYDLSPRYGQDYHLGDICEIQSDTLGIKQPLRLMSVDVVSEGGTVKLYPTFGGTVPRLRSVLSEK